MFSTHSYDKVNKKRQSKDSYYDILAEKNDKSLLLSYIADYRAEMIADSCRGATYTNK